MMDYELLLDVILEIAKEMLKSGAETDRAEDSVYRMVEAYDMEKCNCFIIQSDIQATIKPRGERMITQIRRVHRTGFNYDRLDYLNNLSRYICANKPEVAEIQEKLQEVLERPEQPVYLQSLGAILGGIGFGVYFGCDFLDAVVGTVICVFVFTLIGGLLDRRERNMVVYNFVLSFLASALVFFVGKYGLGHHPDRIILGLSMVLISGLGVTNGIRDILNHAYISGILCIMKACLGAIAISGGIGLSMILFKGYMYEMYISPSILVQLVTCGIASAGFALVFKTSVKQSISAGVGGAINCACYLIALELGGNSFLAVVAGATSVAVFAYIMSRVHKTPATVFLTTSIMPVIPGATLFYMMHGLVQADYSLFAKQTLILGQTCMAISVGFLLVEVIVRYAKEPRKKYV